MNMDTPVELPDSLKAALNEHGEQLLDELRCLEAMPQVRLTPGCVFDRAKPPGSDAHKRGIICKLSCCGKQLDVKCNTLTGDAACPSVLDAARRLRKKISEQHGGVDCLELAQQAQASTGPPANAFTVMLRASLGPKLAEKAMKQTELQLQLAQTREAAARQEREAAEQQLEEALDEARRVGILGAKKQKAEKEWRSREYGQWPDVAEYWRQEEGRVYGRRREKLSAEQSARPAEQRPRGIEGPLQHWRYRLVGAL